MPSISDRPYTGTWRNNMHHVVRHTPDALVFVNGDISIPGCESCRGRIDLQRYITGVSVDAGTLPGSLSATITMAIPKISGDQIFRDGYNKLFPGLEVNIYMRGYFPMKGFFGATPTEDLPKVGDQDVDWNQVPAYPYYPVFHGVVTNVSGPEYSGGEYHATLSCASLLHFWQYHNMITSNAYYAERPDNSPVRQSMMGNDYNNMHPFAVIYNLFRNTQGAAGGVAYMLDGVSNLDATMDSLRGDEGKSLWSFVQDYWAQRFRSRIQNLRMYGVNGNLFNAAQQAFLGKRNQGDLKNLLSNVQFLEDGSLRDTRDPFSGELSVAKALGFDRSGFDFVFAPNKNPDAEKGGSINEGPASLNLLDMYAFTQQAQDIGSVNYLESTFETKLQMAEAVLEITGYEFYQDVDGDLVFKPPFYNLDTSSNRVYRIEDIDIISINFQQGEPEATWIKVKTTWFKGTQGHLATDGLTNREATFVDWSLVSQFGWRPANIEISYTTDVRAAFFIGQARLDLLNIGVNSASVTIPIRPEMRPGIPVYIPFVDCFYYLSQLSHGFQFGGQCTTSLQLTCRRRKFFAPGYPNPPAPGQSVLDLIRLDRTDLPQRPIRILKDGLPRLAGFPNVVMALDPRRINPKYLSVGAGLPHLESTDDVQMFFDLIREDLRSIPSSPLQEVGSSQANNPTQAPQESTEFRLQTSEDTWIQFSIEDLAASYLDLQNAQKEVNRLKTEIDTKRNKLWFETQAATAVLGNPPTLASNTSFQALQQELAAAESRLEEVVSSDIRGTTQVQDGDLTLESEGVNNGNLFTTVLQIADLARGQPSRRKVDGIPDSDITASQLDILDHLKSNYTANAIPGYYRYYSASHPNPSMQGQPAVFLNQKNAVIPSPTTSGTGGGASPSSTTPVPSLPPFDPSSVNTDGLTNEQALVAQFKAAKITWVNPTSFLDFRNGGGSQSYQEKTGQTAEQIKATPLSMEVVNNLLNISTAGQELVNRWTADPRSAAFRQAGGKIVVRPKGSWRPNQAVVESDIEASQHILGKALDLSFSPRVSEADDPEAASIAYTALTQLAQIMWQEGLIGGVGFYPKAGFIHIDVRDKATTWLEWVDPGQSDGRYVYPELSCQINVGGDEPQPKRAVNTASCAWWADFYETTNFPGIGAVRANRRKRIKTYPQNSQTEAPKVGEPPPPEPVPEPPPPENIENYSDAAIQLVDIDLPTPRQVVGFVPPTSDDPQLRLPEADIGLVTATKGLIIAKGPDASPAIVSTDMIQTFQFVQFRSNVKTAIRGDTQNGGDASFLRSEFKTLLSERFFNAAQGNDPSPDSTPISLFKELWDLIRADLSENPPGGKPAQVPLPRFSPDNPQTDPDFLVYDEAFVGAVIPDFQDAVVVQDVKIDIFPLSELKSFPQFAAPSGVTKQGKKGQNFNSTLTKLADAYSEVLTGIFEKVFDGLQVLAMEPGKGREARLSLLTGQMDLVSNTALDSDGFKSTENNKRTIKIEKFATIGKPIHTPVIPISDGQGYEHFGNYRYGRGLTIEPGGTFAFLHNNDDPFGRLSANAASELVDTLSLIKQGNTTKDNQEFQQNAQAQLAARIEEIRAEEDTQQERDRISQLPVEEQAQATAQLERQVQSRAELRLALSILMQTQTGQAAVNELLTTNPAPDGSVEVIDDQGNINATQLERKFSNFAVSYAKDASFKTSVANSAFRLVDLTSHVQSPDLSACSCKGATADVALLAFGRQQFLAVEGIDPNERPAEAFVAEQILLGSVDYFYQQQALRGQVLNPNMTPNALSFEGIKHTLGTGLTNVRTGFSSIGTQFSDIPESFRTLRS